MSIVRRLASHLPQKQLYLITFRGECAGHTLSTTVVDLLDHIFAEFDEGNQK